MKTRLVLVAAATMLVAVLFLQRHEPRSTESTTVKTKAQGAKLLSRLPAAFVPNLGQWEHPAAYVARIGAMTVFLEEKGWTFTLVEQSQEKRNVSEFDPLAARELDGDSIRGVAVRMAFLGAGAAELTPELRLPGVHHYFLGNDRDKWRSDVSLYGAVRYRGILPGVDVLAREHDGHFEYDLVLEPGAELDDVEISVEGIDRMHIDSDGALVLETTLGPVKMPAPPSWEEGPSGEKSPIACRYVLRGESRFGFETARRRHDWVLVVDPGLVWATYLGGTHIDLPLTLTVDAQGAAIIVGWTSWVSKFPTTPGAFNRTFNGGNWDAFVAKLSPTGSSLVYSTFLGGAGREWAMALAVDSQGAGYCRWVDRFGKLPNHASSIRHKLQRHRPDWRRLRYATLTHGRETRLLDFPWREHG